MNKSVTALNNQLWTMATPVPFLHFLRVGNLIFVGGQLSFNIAGEVLHAKDIKQQTRVVFENMKKSLAAAGAELSDLVNLNTYYVYDGPEEKATAYWEDMTRVRLEYFPDPGPAATAVRVKGMPFADCLIQIEGIALVKEAVPKRQRIMPADSWDWSISVPLSQGWRVNDEVFFGGQISADNKGHAVHVGDIPAQTRKVLRFIERVAEDAGGNFDDIVRLKICFQHDGDQSAADAVLKEILTEVDTKLKHPVAISAFGVNLLYEGLVLEIDATAILGGNNKPLPDVSVSHVPGFPSRATPGMKAERNIYIAGQLAIDKDGEILYPGDHAKQLEYTLKSMERILTKGGADLNALVKLNLFYVANGSADELHECFSGLVKILSQFFQTKAPAFTAVRIHGLPVDGALVQVDGVAIIDGQK